MIQPSIGVSLVVYLASAFGLAYILGHAKITRRAREWAVNIGATTHFLVTMIECPACIGIYIGSAFGLLRPEMVAAWWGGEETVFVLSTICSLLTCTSNYAISRATGLIERD